MRKMILIILLSLTQENFFETALSIYPTGVCWPNQKSCNSCGCFNVVLKYEITATQCFCDIDQKICKVSINVSTCSTCVDGYYSADSGKICMLCLIPCKNCSSATECTTCLDSSKQIPQCICALGQTIVSDACVNCINNCKECSTTTSTCTACDTTAFRVLQSTNCVCQTGYVEISGICHKCQSPCATCSSSTTHCESCVVNSNLDSSNICLCVDGYIQINNACTKCASVCQKCQGNIDFCTACISKPHLQLDSFHGQCICDNGYIFDQNSLNCQQCQPPCKFCETTINDCTSCLDSSRELDQINKRCNCPKGYYQNASQNCIECQSLCKTCDQNGCLSCIDINQHIQINQCICNDGYYWSNNICLPCQENCHKCQDQDKCLQCSDNFYLDNYQCYHCNIQLCQGCLNENICLNCMAQAELVQSECSCKSGYYYENSLCNQCIYPCIQCESISKCLQCSDIQNIQLNNFQCQCLESYFYNQSTQLCEPCDNYCLACSIKSTNCLSCKEYQNRVFSSNKCICIDNYFENSFNQCEICTSIEAKSVKSCNYKDCTDQIWTYGEQCDDGNDLIKDGCNNCKIELGYYCINRILQKSDCYKCPENCTKCSTATNQQQLICNQVEQGYFLTNSSAGKCAEQCLTCINTATNCLACKYINVSLNQMILNCKLCNEMNGYYKDSINNSCYTQCGDQIKAGTEECDDGNIIDGDGCDSQCKIEKGFFCQFSTCTIIKYPLPNIQEIKNDSTINTRQVQVTYDEPLKIIGDFNISEIISVNILNSEGQNIEEYLQISQHVESYSEELNQFSFTVTWFIVQNQQNYKLIVLFLDTSKIINENNEQQQEKQLSIILSDYSYIPDTTIILTQAAITSSKVMIYLILAIFVAGLLFGGIDIYYNLLDTLQQFYYLKYINTNLPYNVIEYFQSFGFVQLTFLQNKLNLQDLFDQYLNVDMDQVNQDVPLKMKNDGFSGCFLINASSYILLCFLGLSSYLFAKSTRKQFTKLRIPIRYQELENTLYVKLLVILFFIKHYFISILTATEEYFYSGIFRGFISCSNDLSFFICLGLFSINFNISAFAIQASNSFLMISVTGYFIITLTTFIVVNRKQFEFKQKGFKVSYGSLLDGVKINRYNIIYNPILLIKRFLFMSLIVFLYDYPILQSLFSFLLPSFTIINLFIFSPTQNKLELGLGITSLILSIYCVNDKVLFFDQNRRLTIGWMIIISQMLALLTQMILNIIQQWKYLYLHYKIIRKIFQKVSSCFKSQPIELTDQQGKKANHEILN